MQAPVHKIAYIGIPFKAGGHRSVGPFVTATAEEGKNFICILVFLHSDVSDDTKILIEKKYKDTVDNSISPLDPTTHYNSITLTVTPEEGSKSDITSDMQNLWSILVGPIEGLRGKEVEVVVNFNEKKSKNEDGLVLGEPKRGTKVILP